MTDLNERFAAMLDGEPAAPFDLDRVVAGGRRALRRRRALVSVAGTAGTAAVTAAVVVPLAASHDGGSSTQIQVLTSTTAAPTPTPTPTCKVYVEAAPHKNVQQEIRRLARTYGPDLTQINGGKVANGRQFLTYTTCPPGAVKPWASTGHAGTATPTPTPTSHAPAYHYDADPATIANGFAATLAEQVKDLGLTSVYTRPFAQESSTLEKGHPTYYDGNVDVRLSDGVADVGVQVTHETTEQVPFDGACAAPDCTRTTLADGSVMQVSEIHSATGGGEIVAVEVHHSNGLVVEAQESNYAFGPDATRARTASQPLTIDQLKALATNPAWTF